MTSRLSPLAGPTCCNDVDDLAVAVALVGPAGILARSQMSSGRPLESYSRMTSYSPLEALRLDIVKVSVRIDEVDQELAAAQQSGLAVTGSYLRDTLLELRKEKDELRKQETILLQANVPGQYDASHRPVPNLCIGRRLLQTH